MRKRKKTVEAEAEKIPAEALQSHKPSTQSTPIDELDRMLEKFRAEITDETTNEIAAETGQGAGKVEMGPAPPRPHVRANRVQVMVSFHPPTVTHLDELVLALPPSVDGRRMTRSTYLEMLVEERYVAAKGRKTGEET